jgi:hypothetical protein
MPPRLSEAEIEKLRVLYEDSPLPVTTLALQTGHAPAAIYAYARRRGWKPRADRRGPRLPRAEIRALYEGTIVPVSEIARLAGVSEHTVYVYLAAARLALAQARRGRGDRRSGRRSRGSRARAGRQQGLREVRAIGRRLRSLAQIAGDERRRLQRAARERAKKAGTYKRVWMSPQELVARGLSGAARVYLPRPEPAAPPAGPSRYRDESE